MKPLFAQWKKLKFCCGSSAFLAFGLSVSLLPLFCLSASAAYPDSGLETDMSHIRNELGTMSQNLSGLRQDVQSQTLWVQAISGKMDSVDDALYDLNLSVDQIEVSSDSQVSILDDIRRYERLNGEDLDVIRVGVANVASNTAALHYLPDAMSNAIYRAVVDGFASVSNSFGANLNIWEPFAAWTNFFLSWLPLDDPDTLVGESAGFWFDGTGFYVTPWLRGWDEVHNFPAFLSLTVGGLFDNSRLDEWTWENVFSSDDETFFTNWYWWMAEGVRRQLNVQTNIWFSSLENGNRLSALTNMVSELSSVLVYSNNLSRSVVDEATHDLTNNLGFAQPEAISSYQPDPETNRFANADFTASVEQAVVPSFDSSSATIVQTLTGSSSEWSKHGGLGLFRVTNPGFKTALTTLAPGLSSVQVDGTFEVDLNSEPTHAYTDILDSMSDGFRNLYDLAKYLFYIFCVYCEIRYYLSSGRSK